MFEEDEDDNTQILQIEPEQQYEKLDQNEELAKLRANTSIEKTILSKTLPNADQMMPNIDIIRKEN